MPRLLPRVALVVLLALPRAGVRADDTVREWRFDVSIDGIGVGEHRYVVTQDGARRTVRSDAVFRVRLLLVDAYHWEQHVDETWQGDCLESFASRTVEQGRVTTAQGRDDGTTFRIDGAEGETHVARCPMTFAYWNDHVLERSALVNAQTGASTPVTVERVGVETLAVRGRNLRASHWRLDTPRNRIELWYADDGDWLAMRTTTRDGHVLRYRRS